MDRYNFEEHITAYIDNELTESKKKEFEDIMESDSECKIKYEEIKNLVNNLQTLPKLKTGSNFNTSLKRRIDMQDDQGIRFSERIKNNFSYLWSQPNFGFAISICILFLGTYLFINNSSNSIAFNADSNPLKDLNPEEEIYLSDADSTEEINEYEGEILQTGGRK